MANISDRALLVVLRNPFPPKLQAVTCMLIAEPNSRELHVTPQEVRAILLLEEGEDVDTRIEWLKFVLERWTKPGSVSVDVIARPE